MKKVLALLVICFMLMTTLASCEALDVIKGWFTPDPPVCEEHTDTDGDLLCDNCGAQLEAPKPHEHTDADGNYVCDECGEELERPEKVLVEDIIVSTDDEDGEGTLENPFTIYLAESQSVSLSYAVQPKNATDKTFTWGIVDSGVGLSFDDNGVKLTITAADDATSALVKGQANDGSGVEVYISVIVESYTGVDSIISNTLLADETGEYDYIFVTALGTKWDMSADELQRKYDLMNGDVKEAPGLQAPRNITYWPNLRNFEIVVSPADATDRSVLISYSEEGIIKVDIDGSYTSLAAGETVVTVSSYTEPDVKITIKVVVKDSFYPGILMDTWNETPVATLASWDLDVDHGTDAQWERYDDWHNVILYSTYLRGQTGSNYGPAESDYHNKIFYMGMSTRPYGICIDSHVRSTSGVSLTDPTALIWAKVRVPETAVTLNVKLGNNEKLHGQYRVLWLKDDGTPIVMKDWTGFTSGPSESTQKFNIPEEIKGTEGAIVIEHRVTEYDNNAELQIKVIKFEGYNPVTGVELKRDKGTYKPGQSFNVVATIKPDNATNAGLTFYMAEGSADKGVTVDANGLVTIGEDVAGGDYIVVAASTENPEIKAEYTLTVTAEEIVPNKWDGKSEILNGVQGVKWEIVGQTDAGVGEGADLKVTGGNTWSSLKLDNKKITPNSFMLKFGARVFVRPGETYPHFVVKVNGEVVRGVGQSEDYFYVESDETLYCSYDLSKWIGQSVTVEIGITQGTHAVVQYIEFFGSEEQVREWADKSELQDVNRDPWNHEGSVDAGVGEGYDIKKTGSYIFNRFLIGSNYNSQFTFGGRVFHRPNETYPEVYLVVIDESNVEHIITAEGAENNYVYFDTDEIQRFTYDLSAFAGQQVIIQIKLKNNATHCVITDIKMTGNISDYVEPELEPVTEWLDKADLQDPGLDPWAHVGSVDAGVGEGYDIKKTGSYIYNSFVITKGHNNYFTFGGRVFHRDGETYPEVYLVVVDEAGVEHTITAVGAENDYVYFDTDEIQHFTYDLSSFAGQRVEIRIQLKNNATHCAITDVRMAPELELVREWFDKADLQDPGLDPWAHVGSVDAGVGEGYDIKKTGSYLHNSFFITAGYNNYFTFGGRVFHRDGETYPEVYLVVVDEAGVEHTITAVGAENDYVYFDTDEIQHFTYDLSKFVGERVEIRIQLKNNATHCAITDITMAGATAE